MGADLTFSYDLVISNTTPMRQCYINHSREIKMQTVITSLSTFQLQPGPKTFRSNMSFCNGYLLDWGGKVNYLTAITRVASTVALVTLLLKSANDNWQSMAQRSRHGCYDAYQFSMRIRQQRLKSAVTPSTPSKHFGLEFFSPALARWCLHPVCLFVCVFVTMFVRMI